MSKKDTMIARLRRKPKDFTISELDTLMSRCNCQKSTRGRSSGSAIAYIHIPTGQILNMHSPHPNPTLKPRQINDVIDFLERVSEI